MRILLRVDAGGNIGLGHYYRSINLSQKLHANGHEVFFIHLYSEFWKNEILKGFSFPHLVLEKSCEEEQTLQFLTNNRMDIFYVDGIIDFRKEFIQKVKEKAKVIFYQNNGKSRYLADVFILPSIHQDNSFFKVFTNETTVFKGLEFFTFHPCIYHLPRKQNINEKIRNMAFAAGGSDPANTLRKMFEFINLSHFYDVDFVFYFGNDYLFKDSIPENLPKNIRFELFGHSKILQNDILITAFGVSTYEFLYLGMPIISYGHQESNASVSDKLAKKTDAFISLGEINVITQANLVHALNDLKDPQKREKLSGNAKSLLDLQGAERIVKIIETSV